MRSLLFILITALGCKSTIAQKTDPWTQYMSPGEIHNFLKGYAGAFNMEISMWMTEGEPPVIINVASKNKMILGGRFLEMSQTGLMMGLDYQSVTTLGFNNSSNDFVLTTITNMGTGILMLEGKWDEQKKTTTLFGQMTNPVDGKKIKIRQQISFADKDIIIVESFDQNEGEPERKSVQYKLSRKK